MQLCVTFLGMHILTAHSSFMNTRLCMGKGVCIIYASNPGSVLSHT